MILRRSTDSFSRTIRESLGGQLFAVEGQVDMYFKAERIRERVTRSVAEHIHSAPARESEALKRAMLESNRKKT